MKSRMYLGMIAQLAVAACILGTGCDYHSRPNAWSYREARDSGIIVTLRTHFGETEAGGDWEWRSYRKGRPYSEQPVFILFESYDGFTNQPHPSATTVSYLTWSPAESAQIEKGEFPLHFALVRPAGRWDFQGTKGSSGSEGTYQFMPDAFFIEEANALLGERPGVSDLIKLSISGASIKGLRRYKAAFPTVDLKDWLKLVDHGVTAEFAEAMRNALGEIPVDALIEYRNNGMTPQFASSMREALGEVTVRALIECRNSGLSPEYAADFSRAGYAFNSEELIKLRNSGMGVDFAADLKKGGMNLDVDELIRLRNSGVPASYALRVRELRFGDGVDDIVKMHNSGVDSRFISAIRESGYQASIEEIIKLRNSGVTAGFINSIVKLGYSFSVDQMINLRNNGVTEGYLAEILEPGHKPLPAETIIELHSRGIPARTIRAVRSD